jgi:hypothetical protein
MMVGMGVGVSVAGNQIIVAVGTGVEVDVAVGMGVSVAEGIQALRKTVKRQRKKDRNFILCNVLGVAFWIFT